MQVTVQFPIFDARGLSAVQSTRLIKPNWPLPLPGRQFVRGFGGIVSRRVNGLKGFFSEERLCDANKALRLVGTPHTDRDIPVISFRRLFADGHFVVKFEIGFELHQVNSARQLNRQIFSTILAQLLKRKVIVGQSCDTTLVNAGKPLANFYCKATTYRPTGLKRLWSRLKAAIETRGTSSCFAGQPFVSLDIASRLALNPQHGRVVRFHNAFLWTWDQKLSQQNFKVIGRCPRSRF